MTDGIKILEKTSQAQRSFGDRELGGMGMGFGGEGDLGLTGTFEGFTEKWPPINAD